MRVVSVSSFFLVIPLLSSNTDEESRKKKRAPASHCRLFLKPFSPYVGRLTTVGECRPFEFFFFLSVICVVAHFTSDRFTALFIISLFQDDFLLKSFFLLLLLLCWKLNFRLYIALSKPKMTNLRVAH